MSRRNLERKEGEKVKFVDGLKALVLGCCRLVVELETPLLRAMGGLDKRGPKTSVADGETSTFALGKRKRRGEEDAKQRTY